jgi:hypothetical protein
MRRPLLAGASGLAGLAGVAVVVAGWDTGIAAVAMVDLSGAPGSPWGWGPAIAAPPAIAAAAAGPAVGDAEAEADPPPDDTEVEAETEADPPPDDTEVEAETEVDPPPVDTEVPPPADDSVRDYPRYDARDETPFDIGEHWGERPAGEELPSRATSPDAPAAEEVPFFFPDVKDLETAKALEGLSDWIKGGSTPADKVWRAFRAAGPMGALGIGVNVENTIRNLPLIGGVTIGPVRVGGSK